MLHPFRRQIQQLKPLLMEILNHTALFKPGEAGVKRRRRDLPLLQTGHLILHECDERRNDQGQPWQDGRRQLIAERLALPSRHDRHRVAPSQHGTNDLFLARPKLRKAEPFAELSSQIIHGEIRKTMDGWEALSRAEYRRPTDCGQVKRAEVERSTLKPSALSRRGMKGFLQRVRSVIDTLHVEAHAQLGRLCQLGCLSLNH